VAGLAGHAPLQADWALGTGHTGAGGQCKDAVYTGIGVDRLACILHYYTQIWISGALG